MSDLLALSALRKQLKQQRALLAPHIQKQCASQMLKHLRQQAQYGHARHIALYLPVRGEADPSQLKSHALSRQHFYLPVLSPWRKGQLVFIEWCASTRFRHNRFNIPEPIIGSAPLRLATHLDVVITPLVAFDANGNRLGMGGGFYDRSFAFKRQATGRRPHLVGFAYQFQQVAGLPNQWWDVSLDAICTETGYRSCRNARKH